MYYMDDPDQLPELPDPGPRDGRHGVDRDTGFDPYPPVHFGPDTGGDLAVSVPDAKWHLDFLLDRVQAGEEIIVMRHGHPVAMLVQPRRRRRIARVMSTSFRTSLGTSFAGTLRSARLRRGSPAAGSVSTESLSVTIVDTVSVADADGGIVELVTTARSRTRSRSKVFPDEGDQLPELPDPGPRDGRHGVDNEGDDTPLYFPLSR